MSWRELISDIDQDRQQPPGIAGRTEFYPATTAQALADAASELQATLPVSLRSLLLETNGVMDMLSIDGGEWFESMWLLWTLEEIVAQNRRHREANVRGVAARDFLNLVFFADAGTDGILFGFPVEDMVCSPRIMVWYPLRDELVELAPSLEEFLRGWLTGAITV